MSSADQWWNELPRTRLRRRHHRSALLLVVLLVSALPALADNGTVAADPGAVARRIVAEAIGVKPDDVRVVSIAPRAFPDGSLGCPQSGAAFAQVITPGHVVITEASGRRFDVRVAGAGGRICRGRGQSAVKASGDGAGRAMQPAATVQAARSDLAAKLQVSPEAVALVGTKPARPDEKLPGCQPACKESAGSDCGIVVTLELEGRRYQYLGTDRDFQSCPPLAVR